MVLLFMSFVIGVSSYYKGVRDLKLQRRKGKGRGKKIRVQFDVTLSVKPQKTSSKQQFNYLIYSRSYLTFNSVLINELL